MHEIGYFTVIRLFVDNVYASLSSRAMLDEYKVETSRVIPLVDMIFYFSYFRCVYCSWLEKYVDFVFWK